ncbi:MAG TPA: MarR family winged helix-turn-helix transcriptional regulator [Rhizobiaceae bacterium]|nr:MarR family winged helix-turn-helix transcriptional regulator [Rhizobiaceae bacterium]
MTQDIVRALGLLCLGTRMKRIGDRLQAETQRIMQEFDVPVQAGQYPLMAAIDRLGPLSIGELAEAVGITQPGATRAASLLVKLGVFEMKTAKDDQRRRVLSLTKHGQALVAQGKREVWPQIEGAVADLCNDLSGPLLGQLAAIEDGLDEAPLIKRRPVKRKPRR